MLHSIDIGAKNVKYTFIKFATPSILAIWVFALYTMVDGMFVGIGVGPKALAAVNLSLPYISIMFALSILITIGAGVLVGKYKGEGDEKKASIIFSKAIYSLLFLGCIICTISYLYVDKLAYFLGARGELIPLVIEYLSTLLFFQVFYLIAYSMEVFAKIDGFPQRELGAIICAALTNIILDYVFVIILGWGLKGAALATGCAQLLQLSLLLLHFIGKRTNLKFKVCFPNIYEIFSFIRIGIPDSITEMSSGFVLFAFNNAILYYLGTDDLSAFSVIGYINNFVLITFIGLTQGMQPIVTFSRGKQDWNKIIELSKFVFKVTVGIGFLFLIGIYFHGDKLSQFFLEDSTLIKLAHDNMIVFGMAYIFMGLNIVISGFFTSLEQPRKAGLISFLRGFILIALFLITLPKLVGPQVIWWILFIAESITMIVSVYFYKTHLRNQVNSNL